MAPRNAISFGEKVVFEPRRVYLYYPVTIDIGTEATACPTTVRICYSCHPFISLL